jgi:hypothetical protein
MQAFLRKLLCLSGTFLAIFFARPSQAQEDTLEQPFGPGETPAPAAAPASPSAPPPSPSAPSAPSADVVADTRPPQPIRPLEPIRGQRRLALLGEVGWNGIAGFGPTLTFHATPHIAFDLGAGLSLTGWKLGLRGRYNLLEGPVTPFIGAGFMGTSGLGELLIEEEGEPDVTIRVKPSAFIQAAAGVDWTSRRGFTLVGAVGWAFLLNDNLDVVAGTPTAEQREAFDVLFRSGLVLTVGTGYSFD